ncbi:unnamed protein product [Mytilus edulis]|uniref:Uncharacterized protein n=1 Tax=Mytilus edulis TaxID=6550 RepID=A0A8S3QN84_MYTED|nr:unnamed protein product [Mytilus edulis]
MCSGSGQSSKGTGTGTGISSGGTSTGSGGQTQTGTSKGSGGCPPFDGGGQGAGGCPPFDVSVCDMDCVSMDDNGCLSCNCPASTVSSGSNTTVVTGTTQPPQGAGGCPAFDASTCDMSCVAMDSNGWCFTSLTFNNSTVNTFGPGTLGGGTGGTSSNNGGCSAITTTIKPLVRTTEAHVTLPTTTTAPVTTTAILTTTVPMATTDSNVCPPIRCVAPCNVGITFGPDNCPICRCKIKRTTTVDLELFNSI